MYACVTNSKAERQQRVEDMDSKVKSGSNLNSYRMWGSEQVILPLYALIFSSVNGDSKSIYL